MDSVLFLCQEFGGRSRARAGEGNQQHDEGKRCSKWKDKVEECNAKGIKINATSKRTDQWIRKSIGALSAGFVEGHKAMFPEDKVHTAMTASSMQTPWITRARTPGRRNLMHVLPRTLLPFWIDSAARQQNRRSCPLAGSRGRDRTLGSTSRRLPGFT